MSTKASDYHRNVFVNCPFDAAYMPLFRALVFSIIDCGFLPRTALDVVDGSQIRIQKIYETIASSRLGVHDLSRVQLDDATGLPRFNMPLELGIFLGAKFLDDRTQRQKACLVFDEKPYRYQSYLSDVAGQDIAWHANDVKLVIFRIRDWLAHLAAIPLPSGSLVYDHYMTFQGELRHSCESIRQRPEELTHKDFLHHVNEFNKNYFEALDVDGRTQIKNPTKGDIKRTIHDLQKQNNAYVILGKGATELSFIQAFRSRKADREWELEYQDGHLDKHYKAARRLDKDTTVRIFQNYLEGNEEWRSHIEWERMDIP